MFEIIITLTCGRRQKLSSKYYYFNHAVRRMNYYKKYLSTKSRYYQNKIKYIDIKYNHQFWYNKSQTTWRVVTAVAIAVVVIINNNSNHLTRRK